MGRASAVRDPRRDGWLIVDEVREGGAAITSTLDPNDPMFVFCWARYAPLVPESKIWAKDRIERGYLRRDALG